MTMQTIPVGGHDRPERGTSRCPLPSLGTGLRLSPRVKGVYSRPVALPRGRWLLPARGEGGSSISRYLYPPSETEAPSPDLAVASRVLSPGPKRVPSGEEHCGNKLSKSDERVREERLGSKVPWLRGSRLAFSPRSFGSCHRSKTIPDLGLSARAMCEGATLAPAPPVSGQTYPVQR